jgi:hypothetical protein
LRAGPRAIGCRSRSPAGSSNELDRESAARRRRWRQALKDSATGACQASECTFAVDHTAVNQIFTNTPADLRRSRRLTGEERGARGESRPAATVSCAPGRLFFPESVGDVRSRKFLVIPVIRAYCGTKRVAGPGADCRLAAGSRAQTGGKVALAAGRSHATPVCHNSTVSGSFIHPPPPNPVSDRSDV